MKHEAEIKEYIENKQKDSAPWALETIRTEFNSLIWKEEKETRDWLHLFEWLKNDKNLLQYAELKMKDKKEMKRWDKMKMELLELKLSITCSYFKDFKSFLEELKKWEYESESIQSWNESLDFTDHEFCWLWLWEIQSYPYYKNSETQTTWCSRTAWMNWQNFWLNLPRWDAYDAWTKPWEDSLDSIPKTKKDKKPSKNWEALNISQFNSVSSDINFADIYTESQSNYWHRAVAFKDNTWQRYVLDPYTRVKGVLNNTPKKLEDYMSCKKIVKAHFYKSNWYSNKELTYN